MNDFRPDHRPAQTPPRGFLSLVLTIVVHLGLVVFLFLGINWQSKPVGSLEVGLVGPPSAPAPPAPPPPPAPPRVETPPPAPEPPKAPLPKPEIATKKEPEKKPEKKPEPPEKKPEPKKPEQPLKPVDTRKLFDQKLDQAIKRNEDTKKVNELLDGGGGRQAAGNPGNPGELDAYRAAIAAKVRQNLVAPPNLSGNPKLRFEIEQIMGSRGGQVVNVRLKESSGNRALDEAVERAIRKSDPLPPPDNPAIFNRRLDFTFYPLEERN